MRLSFGPLLLPAIPILAVLAVLALLAAAFQAEGNIWSPQDFDREGRLHVNNTALQEEVERGQEIVYNITIANVERAAARDVTLKVEFDQQVDLVSAFPMPDPSGRWRFGTIEPGGSVNVTLAVRIPRSKIVFQMERSVSGEGFVDLDESYSTTQKPYVVWSEARVTWNGAMTASDRASVNVIGEPGTEMVHRQSGSGNYTGREELRFALEERSIEMVGNVSAVHAPASFTFGNRSVNYTSSWSEEAEAWNRITGTSMNLSSRNATELELSTYINLGQNETKLGQSGTLVIGGPPAAKLQ